MSKCKVCRSEFQKRSITHKCCSVECALTLVTSEKEKKDRKETRKKLAALKTRSQWLKEAQFEFNGFIRERDRLNGLPCISCGRHHDGDNHAGHYRSVGAAPHLRFNENNVHLQCQPCNVHKSGNAIEYRIRLVERIGLDAVEALETDNGIVRWTIEDAKRIKQTYRDKRRSLAQVAETM